MDLFDSGILKSEPLAARMRPKNLDEYIGQSHIVGKGRLLRRAIAADRLTSVIFYGPPGTGKTTLAKVIANHTKSNFITLNAVLTGVQSIRDAIAQAENYRNLYDRKTILFVDEVHRWNRAQQDALLPWVENGTIIFIGATTENPFFEVNRALVSRSRIFQLKPLEKADLRKAVQNTLSDKERGYGRWNVTFEEGALDHLIDTANGDARSLLNAIELAVETTPEKWPPEEGESIYISKEAAEESIQKKSVLYDRDGDYHYDVISAFIKSLRGKDPDAAMYWLARMIAAGEDPHFIFRRMLISACEDTGLADPYAICVVESCAKAFDRIGLPEGRYHLAHAALYLATAPKSNSSMAFFDALSSVEKEDAEVPNHLRDSSRDAEGFGHGEGYLYPHAYKDHWVAQQYLPDELAGRVFYTPTDQGYEAKIKDEVLMRREIQIAAILDEKNEDLLSSCDEKHTGEWWVNNHTKTSSIKKEENLTFSPDDAVRERWQKRTDGNHSKMLLAFRNSFTGKAALLRHHRNLVWNADDGLILWEVSRKSPEGCTLGICSTEKSMQVLKQYASTLPELDQPELLAAKDKILHLSDYDFKGIEFDQIFIKDAVKTTDDIENWTSALKGIPYKSKINLSQKIPNRGQRISEYISRHATDDNRQLFEDFQNAEKAFFESDIPLFAWNEEDILSSLKKEGFEPSLSVEVFEEETFITVNDIRKWFSKNSPYGSFLFEKLGEESLSKLISVFMENVTNRKVTWKNTFAFFTFDTTF